MVEARTTVRDEYLIQDVDEFRERFGDTSERIYAKSNASLSDPMRRFVALSPFCVISSQDDQGSTDISPRGDAPGFVEILTPDLLLLPDRPGNKRFDTFCNVLLNPFVSLLFFIPGVFDTLRVNGVGRLTRDPDLLSRCAIKDKVPCVGMLIEVEEAFGHCSKAIRRSGLWKAQTQIDPKLAPSLVELMMSHIQANEKEWAAQDTRISDDIRDNMY